MFMHTLFMPLIYVLLPFVIVPVRDECPSIYHLDFSFHATNESIGVIPRTRFER